MASRKNLHLASFDGGGAWCFSQLKIMKTIMHQIRSHKHGVQDHREMLPCNYYDLIGGSDAGGLIVIMLVKLRMSVEETIDAFGAIIQEVYAPDLQPAQRSEKLKIHIEEILIRKDKPVNLKLEEECVEKAGGKLSKRCEGFVLASRRLHVTSKVCFRTYPVRNELRSGVTVVEAALATCASLSTFLPVTITTGSRFERQDYIGASLGATNPFGKVRSEALLLFGANSAVASLLSLGSGYVGVIHLPADGSNDDALFRLATDGEQDAQERQEWIGGSGIYFRFSVEQGMQRDPRAHNANLESINAPTEHYLQTAGSEIAGYVRCFCTGTTSIPLESLNRVAPLKDVYKEAPVPAVNYVRRQDPWNSVIKGLNGTKGMQTIMVIAGIPGCGKTQLVLDVYEKYRSQSSSYFEQVFFVDGTSNLSIQADLIAHVQCVSGKDKEIQLEDAIEFLRRNPKWLLIYDGVDDNAQPFLPSCHQGTIIITTRNRALRKFASPSNLNIDLGAMSKDEAIKLILGCASPSASAREEEAAGRIADKLWRLPVALAQAGCYMHDTGLSCDKYLSLLTPHLAPLMRLSTGDRQNRSIYVTLDLTYDRLLMHVKNFIRLLSCFHFTSFPLEVITYAVKLLFRDDPPSITTSDVPLEHAIRLLRETFLPDGVWSELTVPAMTQALQTCSMASVTTNPITTLITIHPLIHQWASDRVLPEEQIIFHQAACCLIVCCRDAKQLAKYLPLHIGAVMSKVPPEHLSEDHHAAFGRILTTACPQSVWLSIKKPLRNGSRHSFLNVVIEAVQFDRRVKAEILQEKENPGHAPGLDRTVTLGRRRLETLEVMSELSNSLSLQNKHNEALRLQRDVVDKLEEAQLPADNPAVVEAVALWIRLRRRRGSSPEPEPVPSPMLGERKRQLGEAYLDTMNSIDKLAWTYYQQESLSDAAVLQYNALEGFKARLGKAHPKTLHSMSKLATIYQQQGCPEEAEPLQSEVLAYRKQALGHTHPDTLDATCFLASTYGQQRRYDEALPLLVTLLKGWKQNLGVDHPDTLRAMSGLALVYHKLREYTKAECLRLQAYKLCTALEGEGSRAAATCANDLAWTYYYQDRLSEAEKFALKAEKARKVLLGEGHRHYKDTARLITLLEHRRGADGSSVWPQPSIPTLLNGSAGSSPDVKRDVLLVLVAACLFLGPNIGWLVSVTFSTALYCLL